MAFVVIPLQELQKGHIQPEISKGCVFSETPCAMNHRSFGFFFAWKNSIGDHKNTQKGRQTE